jgi:hypothetical protein
MLRESHNSRLNQSFGRKIRANTLMKMVWDGNRDSAHHTFFSDRVRDAVSRDPSLALG